MIITNKTGLPDAFVQMAEQSEQMKEGRIRVTTLLNGIREIILKDRYLDQVEQDAAEMIWLLFGTGVHTILERQQEGPDAFKEERLEMEIGGKILTGKSDFYQHETISDWKTCSVWKVVHKDYEDWKRQLLMYAMLWKSYGFPVKKIQVVATMKDHSKAKAKTDASYPQYPVKIISWDITDEEIEETRIWAENKIRLIEEFKDVPDEKLPRCTQKETWNSGTTYAVMKNGRKNAYKVCSTEQEAYQWMKENGKGEYVEVRPGEDKKCKEYCMVRDYCQYAKELMR